MARRRQSDLNAWLKLFALLPWPVLIALAIISAYSFRELANGNPIHQIQASDYAAPPVIPMLIHGFSTVLQYVAPAFFTVAAVLSWYPRRRRRHLVSNLSPERLAAMSVRIARKGPHAGESFLGCSRYPACRGTRPMPGSTASETRE